MVITYSRHQNCHKEAAFGKHIDGKRLPRDVLLRSARDCKDWAQTVKELYEYNLYDLVCKYASVVWSSINVEHV